MLTEYPRPQLERNSYLSLNGTWEYEINKTGDFPVEFSDTLIVPYSLECKINKEKHILQPDEYLFYHKKLDLPDGFIKDKLILHFTAVDQIADVYINSQLVISHEGGFLPFEVDIKPYLQKENHLIVRVRDVTDTSYLSRGKQKLKHGKIWYTPQSGIYLPVWMESVSNDYIQDIHIIPDIDKWKISVLVKSDAKKVILELENEKIELKPNVYNDIQIKQLKLWSPEDPYLYKIKLRTEHDEVSSYFAMRKFSKEQVDGHYRFYLNNKPYFLKGVLDQGYYKNGLLTPEKDEDYIRDIQSMKSLGFNTLRKHIKIESLRWYAHCDRLGMLVIQDFVNGGSNYHFPTIAFPLITGIHHKDTHYAKFSRRNKEGRIKARQEFIDTINYLKNVPCICSWTIFNEGWGQFDSKEIYKELVKLDNTRLYDHASGWHDQGVSDYKSLHVYFKKFKMPKERTIKDRIVLLSECGGYNLSIPGHESNSNYGYKRMDNPGALVEKYASFISEEIIPAYKQGLSGFIYTQLSDVEDECNGFLTFDREVLKVDKEKIKAINDGIA